MTNTMSPYWFKAVITFIIFAFLALALVLWSQVPDLFIYFNQAFCAH
ncbi:MAG: hypothetical protein H9855_13020 [Candidatus Acinetobacter avistercoris]|nr:hypothetical protein [Candidatus Acinetobacter avistercoris]